VLKSPHRAHPEVSKRLVAVVVLIPVSEILVPRGGGGGPDALRGTPVECVAGIKITTGARAGIESSTRAPSCNGLSNISGPLTKQIELCSRG